jgi:hypothetical protein
MRAGPSLSEQVDVRDQWMSRHVRSRAANVSGGFFPSRQRRAGGRGEQRSALNVEHCVGDIGNNNGNLVCNGGQPVSPPPSAAYPSGPGYPAQGYGPQPGSGYPPGPGYPTQGYGPQPGLGDPSGPGYPAQGYGPTASVKSAVRAGQPVATHLDLARAAGRAGVAIRRGGAGGLTTLSCSSPTS